MKAEDPEALVTYVNFPTTEYLELPFLDLFAFNVYLESEASLRSYLARLQNQTGHLPLLMAVQEALSDLQSHAVDFLDAYQARLVMQKVAGAEMEVSGARARGVGRLPKEEIALEIGHSRDGPWRLPRTELACNPAPDSQDRSSHVLCSAWHAESRSSSSPSISGVPWRQYLMLGHIRPGVRSTPRRPSLGTA